MKAPQNTAERIVKLKNHIDVIANYSCCALVYLWCLGIEPDDDITALELVDEAITKGYIEPDCTVIWGKWGTALTGRVIDVEFVDISTIKHIKERTPVKYTYGPNSHWVGVANGKIVFDPLGKNKSNCVKNGKPVSMRRLTVRGLKK